MDYRVDSRLSAEFELNRFANMSVGMREGLLKSEIRPVTRDRNPLSEKLALDVGSKKDVENSPKSF